MREVAVDAGSQALGGRPQLRQAAALGEDLLKVRERLENLLMLVVHFPDEDGIRRGPVQRPHGDRLTSFRVRMS